MTEHKLVPKIRFQGFSEEWEEKRLGEIADIIGGGTPDTSKEEYWNGNINWYSPTEIRNKVYLDESINKITDLGLKKSSAKIHPPYTTILFTSRAGIGDMAIIRTPATTNQGFQSIELKDGYYPYFVYSYNFKIKIQALNLASGSTFLEISKHDMKRIMLFFPVIKEQQKIGDLFSKLDKLIELQQQKVDKLELLKKAFLQKMFANEKQKIPEIRFQGFGEEWEEKRLREFTDRVNGNDGRMNLPTLTISAGNGWMNQKDRFSENIAGNEQKKYTLLKNGELSYNHGNSKLAKYGAVFELCSYSEALVPHVYHSFRAKHNAVPSFIEYMFATKKLDRELRKLVSSGARMDGLLNINYDSFVSINTKIPSSVEQQKIGALFEKLDQLISANNHKLTNLKLLKKSLLQNMFI